MNPANGTYEKYKSIAESVAGSPEVAGFVIKCYLELREDTGLKANLEQVMSDVREYSDASTACVITINKKKKKADIIAQSTREGLFGAEQVFMKVPYGIVDDWGKITEDGACFIMKEKEEIDQIEEISSEWARVLRMEDAKSLCLVPLLQKTETVGYILVTNFNVEKADIIKDVMKIVSIFISTEITNDAFLKRLEWLTSVDLLTGVRNRAAMNRVVDEYAEKLKWAKSPFGVALCMMNGLSYLNQKNGHDAGNKCLEEAGTILRDIFDETEVFRSGGEEFAIVCENADEDDFNEKIEKLRQRCSDPDGVYLAIGNVFDGTEGDIRAALRNANKQMLSENEDFYEKYPEKKS